MNTAPSKAVTLMGQGVGFLSGSLSMFTCREARELLPRYVRGALSAEDFVEVRYHIQGCASCAEEVKQARQAVRLARSGCASVTDPAAEEVPELLLSDIVLVSHCANAAK